MGGLPRDLAWVGSGGSVLALDLATGGERWRTRLRRGGSMVALAADGDRILATAGGELFCLDASTGRVLWRNRLKGTGLGIATVLTAASQSGAVPLRGGGHD